MSTLLAHCDGSLIELLQLGKSDVTTIEAILREYADQKFDLADAALMHLANRAEIETVFTLDRRHFSLYRTEQRKALHIVPEAK